MCHYAPGCWLGFHLGTILVWSDKVEELEPNPFSQLSVLESTWISGMHGWFLQIGLNAVKTKIESVRNHTHTLQICEVTYS
jgi:hypothetical protein